MSRKTAGIDIGVDFLRVVILEKRPDNKIRISGFIEKKIENRVHSAQIIKETFKKNKIRPDVLFVSLPAELTTLRKMSTPFREKDKIRKTINFEIQPLILSSLEDMVVDFYPLKTQALRRKHKGANGGIAPLSAASQSVRSGGAGSSEETELLVSCAERAWVDNIYQDLADINLGLKGITLDSFGLLYLYLNSRSYQPDEITALIKIDVERALIDIVKNSRLVFTRSISNSKDIIGQAEFSLRAFEIESNQKIERVLLIHDESRELERKFFREAGSKVSSFDIKEGLVFPSDMEGKLNKFSTAIGLASIGFMRNKFEGINFNREIEGYKNITRLKKMLFQTGVFALAAIVLLLVNLYASYLLKESRLRSLKSYTRKIFTSTFPGIKNIVNENVQMEEKIDQAKDALAGFKDLSKSTPVMEVLRELSIRLPTRFRIDVDEVIIDGRKIKVKGRVNTPLAVKGVVRELESSVYFKDIEIEESKTISEKDVYFVISLAAK